MKGVGEFILSVLYYSEGTYTPEQIENLINLIDKYETGTSKADLRVIKGPDPMEEYEYD